MSVELHAHFENFGDVQLDLSAIADDLEREVAAGIEDESSELLALTSANTPYATELGRNALGHIRDSFAISRIGGAVAVVSSHPGAIVHERGGMIAPHKNRAGSGGTIRIKESAMASRAGEQALPAMEQRVIARIERLIAAF